jgi:hypothetical protein
VGSLASVILPPLAFLTIFFVFQLFLIAIRSWHFVFDSYDLELYNCNITYACGTLVLLPNKIRILSGFSS